MKRYGKNKSGFTTVELGVTVLISTLVVSGIGAAMVDSIKSFNPLMYQRTQGNLINDAYAARATFDRVCRGASVSKIDTDSSKSWVTLYYYSSPTASSLDRCAQFKFENNKLNVRYGTYNGTLNALGSPVTIAKNITAGNFIVQGTSVIMTITIDNTNDTTAKAKMKMTVTSAAVRHN